MLDPQDEQQSPFPYGRTSAPNYNYMEDFSYPLDGLGPIPTSQRSLLHHFAVYTSMSISCHDSIRESFCKELIPVAVQSSLVLFALLNLAARHRESLGLSTTTTERNFLQSRSMALLLATLPDENRKDDDDLLATILILCMCDIVSRGDQPSSWRLHLQGARAIVSAHLGEGSLQHPPKLRSLLWRWYLSIESLSLLSGATETVSYSRTALQLRHHFGDSEIDILSGFSIALIPFFAEIHLLIIERNSNARRKYHSQPSSAPGLYLVTERARILIDNVRSMLAKKCPKLASPREHTFDARARSDFIALDEVYHRVALLHLYRRVLRIPAEDNTVQQYVSRIIDLISAMTFEAEPCPGVAVLQPIFTAGCEAIEQTDKDNIRLVLNRIERCFGMGNVKSVRMFLENMWHISSSREQSQWHVIWDDLMCKCFLISRHSLIFSLPQREITGLLTFVLFAVEKRLDIVPY